MMERNCFAGKDAATFLRVVAHREDIIKILAGEFVPAL